MDRRDALDLLAHLERNTRTVETVNDETWWLERLPGLPKEVLGCMHRYADPGEISTRCPFNRRIRRRLEGSRGVVVHLFAGVDHSRWVQDDLGYEVLSIDIAHGNQFDLHSLGLWSYLWELASKGLVVGVLGGPPCRTVSRLRHSFPGPRPLRGRGDRGYGLPGLSAAERDLVNADTALFMKQLGLWERAQECAREGFQVAFALESPADPASYDPEAVVRDMPSFWDLAEVESLRLRTELFKVQFDQGALGHPRRKPTTLMTNLVDLAVLHELSGAGTEEIEDSLEKRLKQTKSWAAWAPGLVKAVKMALKGHLSSFGEQRERLKGMSLEAWRDHVRRGHIPYSRDCRTCLREMGVDAHHRRQKGCGAAYTMSADVVGPFEPGYDTALKGKAKYALVVTVAVPVFTDVPQEGVPEDGDGLVPGEDPCDEVG